MFCSTLFKRYSAVDSRQAIQRALFAQGYHDILAFTQGASVAPDITRAFSSKATVIPDLVLSAIGACCFSIAKFPGAGRGLVATKAIKQNELIWKERPMLACPAHHQIGQVCSHCLKTLPYVERTRLPEGSSGQPYIDTAVLAAYSKAQLPYCSEACAREAHQQYAAVQQDADLTKLYKLCIENGERLPLQAAQLACMVLSNALTQQTATNYENHPIKQHTGLSIREGDSTVHPGKQHQLCSPAGQIMGTSSTAAKRDAEPVGFGCKTTEAPKGNPLTDLHFLCYANIPEPYPPPWVEIHEALHAGLHNALQKASFNSDQKRILSSVLDNQLTLGWFVSVLSKLHVNVFKVAKVEPPPADADVSGWSSSDLSSMLSKMLLNQNATTDAGSCTYLVASLFNHSCNPNISVFFPHSNTTAEFRAARDIEAGEQLCITYMDESQPVHVRQEHLLWSYGFACNCVRCNEEQQQQAASH